MVRPCGGRSVLLSTFERALSFATDFSSASTGAGQGQIVSRVRQASQQRLRPLGRRHFVVVPSLRCRGSLAARSPFQGPQARLLGVSSSALPIRSASTKAGGSTSTPAKPRLSLECVASASRALEISRELDELVRNVVVPLDPAALIVDPEAIAVGLDCEGVRLGRFGRVCMVQVALEDGRLFIFDALRPGVVEALRSWLENPALVKVTHDCREDSAALYHQHNIQLRGVFDTQATETVLLRHRRQPLRQKSFADVLEERLGVKDFTGVADIKKMMIEDPQLWARRPVQPILLRYALHGLNHLTALRRELLEDCGKRSLYESTAIACTKAMDYRFLNKDFPTPESMAKIGTRVWAVVAAKAGVGVFFKLNAARVGCATTPGAIGRFRDVELGDTVLCCVSGVSINGRYLYLDRYDPDWDYFDHQLRPSFEKEVGTYGREFRHRTGLIHEEETELDPLLLRCLPAEQLAAKLDAWEASAEDLGLPPDFDI